MARSMSSVTSSSSSAAASIKSRVGTSAASHRTKLSIKTPTSGPVDKRKRLAANARERKRMDLLNKAFDMLRGRLYDARNKSKYDVLVQAKEYIQALARICADHDRDNPDHPSALACGGLAQSVEVSLGCGKEDRLEANLEPQKDTTGHQVKLAINNAATIHWQQPVQSPASSSDCCLSPLSLADSLGSSGSPHCSSQPQHSPYYQRLSTARQNHPTESKTAFLYHRKIQIKQEPMSEIPADYHHIYHPHYQSLFHTQKQTSIN